MGFGINWSMARKSRIARGNKFMRWTMRWLQSITMYSFFFFYCIQMRHIVSLLVHRRQTGGRLHPSPAARAVSRHPAEAGAEEPGRRPCRRPALAHWARRPAALTSVVKCQDVWPEGGDQEGRPLYEDMQQEAASFPFVYKTPLPFVVQNYYFHNAVFHLLGPS